MGYTHYFTQTKDFSDDQWSKIRAVANTLLRKAGHIDRSTKYDQKLFITKDAVRFNGIGDEGHETFYLKKKLRPTEWESAGNCFEKGEEYQFCKTAYKDYDKYVVAMLCMINYLAPDVCRIESDGDKEEWKDGLRLARNNLCALDVVVPKGV
tara:strand:+ start:742 stop:1197 length:456 start_codon:yes stop_codon:yes gene_type:complete